MDRFPRCTTDRRKRDQSGRGSLFDGGAPTSPICIRGDILQACGTFPSIKGAAYFYPSANETIPAASLGLGAPTIWGDKYAN